MRKIWLNVVAALGMLAAAEAALAGWSADDAAPNPWAKIRLRYNEAYCLKRFKAADTDADGYVTREEARAAKLGWECLRGAARWKHADTNGDGALSLAEAKGQKRFEISRIRKNIYEYDQRLRKRLLTPGIDARERYQLIRIRHGIADGSLTPEEARGLLAGERAIHEMERAAKSDGKVTIGERQDLHKALTRMSAAIYKQRHDDEGKQLPPLPPTAVPGVTVRQTVQKARIVQGVKSGELTKGETKALLGGQKKIQHMKRGMKSDGKVTVKERKILHTVQNKQSNRIYRLKHNDNSRPRPTPRPRPRPRPRRR